MMQKHTVDIWNALLDRSDLETQLFRPSGPTRKPGNIPCMFVCGNNCYDWFLFPDSAVQFVLMVSIQHQSSIKFTQ